MKTKVLILVLLLILSSCIGSKKIAETTSIKEKEKTSKIENDSIKKTTINKQITDVAQIPVPKSKTNDKNLDSLVNSKVSEILGKLNFSKQSGSSGYKLSYNELKDLIEVAVTVGETKNVSEKVNNNKEETETDTEYISEYLKKVRGIPLYWIIIALIIVFRKPIFSLLGILYPPLKFTKIFTFATSTGRTADLENRVEQQNELIKQMFNELKSEIHNIKNPL